ncbi:MAG: ABC transporter ATP-binding protein [Epsilonproteobacteria bacterium]|nr:ABC transporter ATP-binding protein [Campylobacterota bacterium]
MEILSAKNLAHSFDYDLFEDVSFDLQKKQSIAIIGQSGSGKSTLLHIISSLLKPNAGEVKLFGKDIYSLKPKKLMQLKREKIGLVFQSHYLFRGLSAYENLEVSEILSGKKIDEDLLEKLDVKHCMEQKVTELSGGQQQRISIARVLTKQPSIIFADEPTGNLDASTAKEVMDLFFDYCKNSGAGMVLVTHDTKLAYMCDKVYKLENKQLIEEK